MSSIVQFGLACLILNASLPTLSAELVIAKQVVRDDQAANLLRPQAWRACGRGFGLQDGVFVCDNGQDTKAQRGLTQTVLLNQTRPEPFVAVAWSKAADVSGSPNNDYSLYLDLTFSDGTNLWGRIASFSTGTHDWERREVTVLPDKPVKQVDFYMLLRGHSGKAWFRNPELRVVKAPPGACLFDGLSVVPAGAAQEGFQVRDVAAGSNFVRVQGHEVPREKPFFEGDALDLKIQWRKTAHQDVSFFDVLVTDLKGADRAVTLAFALPVRGKQLLWLEDPRRSSTVESGREYVNTTQFRVGSSGRLSRYPLGAVANAELGTGLAIDPAYPAFFRVGYSSGTGELYLAYDFGLAREKPQCRLRFCQFTFKPEWGFRAALARYYETFPKAFRCPTSEQGLWMPFASISKIQGWEDFGFKFKEGDNETKWDDQHGILTFHYTEPMSWWMPMPKGMPRTYESAMAEAQRLATQGSVQAKALLTSGCRDAEGRMVVAFEDTPWCNGAVWRMNSMPAITGEVTDFKNKWNGLLRERLYGPKRAGDLDGEYLDSSEGGSDDFCRDHFPAAGPPLVFSGDDCRPIIFRSLSLYDYVHAVAADVHGMNKLMMANGTPNRCFWLAPLLDVMGSEIDWNPGGKWQPMTDADLLYRRAMCRGKPYCFLMNTRFEQFPQDLVEKYMKRCLAYGMFPGFFSHNAAEGHYFSRPALYNRDRPLFKRYVPLCRRVAEAGWEPITLARSSDERVYIERFGERYLTIFNDSPQRRTVTIRVIGKHLNASRELLSGRAISWHDGEITLTLEGEDAAVIDTGGGF